MAAGLSPAAVRYAGAGSRMSISPASSAQSPFSFSIIMAEQPTRRPSRTNTQSESGLWATTLATTSRVADLMRSMAAEAVTSVAPISPSRARRATVRPNRGATTRSKSLDRGVCCGAQGIALHAGTVVAVNIAITRFFVENEATG